MKNSCITTIPVLCNNQATQIEIHPFETPLQIAYQFCQQHKLQFNLISSLSKQIIQYVSLLLRNYNLERLTRSQLSLHFDKFINNQSIRDSMKGLDNSVQIQNNQIVIGSVESIQDEKELIQDDKEFSFENKNEGTFESCDQYQFSFKNKLNDFLHPNEQSQQKKSSRVEMYIRRNSFNQIINAQKGEEFQQKLLKKLKSKSPQKSVHIPQKSNAISYTEYLKNRQHSNFTQRDKSYQQSPIKNTIETLPKARGSIQYSKRSPQQEVSFQKLEESVQSSFHSNGTIVNNISKQKSKTKIDRVKSFQELMKKLQVITTPQKNQKTQRQQVLDNSQIKNKELVIKQQTITESKIEQKINELFTLLDTDYDDQIDHNINLQQLKQYIIDQFEPVWFQILLKKIKINRIQFSKMIQKRIKELEPNEIKRFLFNGIKK